MMWSSAIVVSCLRAKRRSASGRRAGGWEFTTRSARGATTASTAGASRHCGSASTAVRGRRTTSAPAWSSESSPSALRATALVPDASRVNLPGRSGSPATAIPTSVLRHGLGSGSTRRSTWHSAVDRRSFTAQNAISARATGRRCFIASRMELPSLVSPSFQKA